MDRNNPLKVLMLASSYPRSRGDATAIFLRHLAESLNQRGIRVHVLAPADKEPGTRVEGNINVYRFQYFPSHLQKLAYGSGILPNLKQNPWLWVEVPFFIAFMGCSLLRLLWKERPDLIHAHWVLPQGLVAVFAKLFYKAPVITTAHGGDAFALRGRWTTWLKRLVLQRTDAWTANTRATSEAFGRDRSLPKPHIIPMGVDVGSFQGGRRASLRRELPEDEFLILFVGRLVEKKGVDNLLKAFSRLPLELRKQTSLWVIGDGERRTRLEEYAKNLGVSQKTRFWGHISNYLLPDFYAAADLFVAPSIEAVSGDTEGQGVVFLEAFAARVCVLATHVGGISEVIEDGHTGILVEPRNPQQLATTMEKLLGNERLRAELAENAFAKVKKYYEWDKIAKDFEDLYRAVV